MPGYHWLPDRWKVLAQARRGHRDASVLHEQMPALSSVNPATDRIIPDIEQRDAEYILATGTNAEMAASIELCRFLVRWCSSTFPKRIVDLVSGISSWTLRTWRDSEFPTCEIYSVDDSANWLDRSRECSATAGTGEAGFVPMDQFLANPAVDGSFDLVAPGGAIVCDDVQKARIWRAVRKATRLARRPGQAV